MLVGYARVSTTDQNTELQTQALVGAGIDERHIYTDQISGAKMERPSLKKALEFLKKGDVLVVWKLDRLGRSLSDLISLMKELDKRGVGFKSLTENIDTTTPGGKLIFHLFGSLAQFERELIQERVRAGLEAARKQGRIGGRPKCLSQDQIETAKTSFEGGMPVKKIAGMFNVSRYTVYRALSLP